MKNFQETTNKSLANHDECLKTLAAMIENLADNIEKNNMIEESKKTIGACKAVFTEDADRSLGKRILLQEETKPIEKIPCQLPKNEGSS